jgi:hypothetical protein
MNHVEIFLLQTVMTEMKFHQKYPTVLWNTVGMKYEEWIISALADRLIKIM